MTNEEEIRQKISNKFNFLEGKIGISRVRRLTADVPQEKFEDILKYVIDEAGFIILCTITGLDEGENIGIVYHLARTDGIVLNIKIHVKKSAPVVKTIMNYFNGSVIYERELIDMLGVKVDGLPPGSRYPLPDDWPAGQYPLRKDWKAEMLDKKEVKNNG